MAILVYVTLDLSLPTMPGAFVFEPADSVESVGGGRIVTRAIVLLPAPIGDLAGSAWWRLGEPSKPRSVEGERPLLRGPRARRAPGASPDPPPSSEDPH